MINDVIMRRIVMADKDYQFASMLMHRFGNSATAYNKIEHKTLVKKKTFIVYDMITGYGLVKKSVSKAVYLFIC